MKTNSTNKVKALITAGILALTASAASAAMITTTFSSNNGYAGNMFDVTTSDNELNITGLNVNTSALAGTDVTFALYTRIGTYVGSENNAGSWTLQDTQTFSSAGANNASFFDLADFSLASNTTYGFYVDLVDYEYGVKRLLYTSGANSYSNSDLSISAGVALGDGAFSTKTFSPRTWNGSIQYEVVESGSSSPASSSNTKVPDTASTFALFGFGLVSLVGLKRKLRR